MKKNYEVIFFDWHKTLSHCDFWGQLKHPTHARHDWHQNIVNFLFGKNDALVQQWMRGAVNEEEILQILARKFGYSQEILREDLAESCRAMTFLSDKILPLVTALRQRGITCVIATDNMDVFKKYVVPALKLNNYFDYILVSFEQKAFKFDVAKNSTSLPFFHSYLEKNGFNYTNALLFDDRLDSSGTYKKLGFDTFHAENTARLLSKMEDLLAT